MPSALSRLSSARSVSLPGLAGQRRPVSLELGIGVFAKHHHRHIGLHCIATVNGKHGFTTGRAGLARAMPS